MKLEEFHFSRDRRVVSKETHQPLEAGEEVLVINSHVDGRYSCVGNYLGKQSKILEVGTVLRSNGYENIVLDNTRTLPVEIRVNTYDGRDTEEYLVRVLETIRIYGINEGRTLHGLDVGSCLYKVSRDEIPSRRSGIR